ncbi:MAG: response regulator [Candidatus Latescibacteria bacterium]|nr:response regulator [Candidatus Latescibacterota bacterium]NIO56208.1 response regulator [Candidatus Latescibacterota bacterium]
MSQKYRIVLAEDHTILREGVRSLLSTVPDLEIVGEAGDGREAIQCVEEQKPDLILMDLSMPRMNGVEALREIKRRSSETKILVLTVHKTEEYILAALQAGANGYLLKDSTYTELLVAVNYVLRGKTYISPGISDMVVEGYMEGRKTLKKRTTWDTLTKREREILKLIAEGYKNKEIAEDLCISVKTVEKHRANLMEKLNLHKVQALTAYAIERGLVSQDFSRGKKEANDSE